MQGSEKHTTRKNSGSMIPSLPLHAVAKGMSSSLFGYDEDDIAKQPWASVDSLLSEDQYFNYGFDKQSWEAYVERRKTSSP
mmetsp:Transcript_9861/g.14922  ORF Transcript_9861/g.14922 Transcript_9861/m.14922 type:complete len:81 (-) Transcript_9861:121-363(-)